MKRFIAHSAIWLLFVARLAFAQPDGETLYRQSCASCHDAGADRAPTRESFRAMTPARVLRSMETGPMISMAVGRTAAERRAIAEYLTGQSFDAPLVTAPAPQAMRSRAADLRLPRLDPVWNGWGQNAANTFLDLTPFGRQETWEESPKGWPQTPPYEWWAPPR